MGKDKTALYAGTFDPVTFGHLDIMERSLAVYDKLVVAVAENPKKEPLFSTEERLEMIRGVTSDIVGLETTSYDCLTVDFAREIGACSLVRGLRAVSDFEDEFKMALANRKLAEDIDTVFFMPSEQYFYLSSSLIKEIARMGGSIDCFAPLSVAERVYKRIAESGGRNGEK
ncbi:MAG: pantetheine-phosphate adenylyltransferase [bacterium]|nr:pantetheine-phosphate adenylyltransferase [bacterium]